MKLLSYLKFSITKEIFAKTLLGMFVMTGCVATAQDLNATNALAMTNSPVEIVSETNQLDSSTTNFAETISKIHPAFPAAIQTQLNLAHGERLANNGNVAKKILVDLIENYTTPPEAQRLALLELALLAQDAGDFVKAQQCFAQCLQRFPDDPGGPDILMRQGLLYRQMGVTELAISKFYGVMSSCLRLKLGDMDYYKKLVLRAQTEIANTYYLEGKYEEASDFFNRISKSGGNSEEIQFKLIRSLSNLTNHLETVARAQVFLDVYPASTDAPEVRFLLASALKTLGRNQESMKQVMLLLQSQEENVKKNPETWIYWQQRAGNEIANQLYKEGDYFNALQIYLTLADLNKTPSWQVPVWYQIGLVYEQLQQPQKAIDTYLRIMDREKELTETNSTPGLRSLFDMAKWRKDYVAWMEKARIEKKTFQRRESTEQASAAKE